MTLIREKRALRFWDFFISLPIRLSGDELELKMATISTYWKADRVEDGLGEEKEKGRAVRGLDEIFSPIPALA